MDYIKGCLSSFCNDSTKDNKHELIIHPNNDNIDHTLDLQDKVATKQKQDNKKNDISKKKNKINNNESKTNNDITNNINLSGSKNGEQDKSLEKMLKDLKVTGNKQMNGDERQKPINNLEGKDDKKDAKNKNKKAENKDLNKKSKNKDKKAENINKNKDKGNIYIQPLPSQKVEQTKETDKHLHNFLTRIVIKICKLEKSFRNDNHDNCSEFWKNLVGDNKDDFETNDNLFTKVLNRNYNHHNICDNNHILQLLGNNFGDIKGEPTTSEIVNQMVQQKSCEQLERLLRISNEDLQQLEKSKNKHSSSLIGKVLADPMLTTYHEGEVINKSTEIMLMLMKIQDVAFEIYRKSSEKEKQHAKNILLFFRQVLTTLYEKKIISVLDERSILKQVDLPMNNKKYWQQLSSQQQIKQEKSFINFNLNKDTKEIEKIELEKLFWKNGAQYEVVSSHHIQDEMRYRRQCINERTDFALNSSIMLDEIEK